MHKENSLQYFLTKSKELENNIFSKKVKIGILSSFTINGLGETLKVKCAENDLECKYYVGPYDQYSQEIISENSELYRFSPDIVFLLLDIRSLFGDIFHEHHYLDLNERKSLIASKIQEINNLIDIFTKNCNSKLIISNLALPIFSSFGINETKLELGFREMIILFNSELSKTCKSKNNLFIYDFNAFSSKHGQKNIFDMKNYLFGDIQINFDFIPYLAHELVSYVNAYMGLTKKCIVLDLDNTLWGGIVGEDGFENIKLGPQPPGNAFYEFQKTLKAFKNRGIILAINSKNNPDDALKVIREHPYMILKEDDFSCIKINWDDKVENMKEISEELNLGLDSFVFFDDDKLNCEFMKISLPQVKVVNLNGDPAYFSDMLQNMNDFDSLNITSEDLKRAQMYTEQVKRDKLKKSSVSMENFLKNLDIYITIKKSNNFTIPRISQLTLKTNQFNLTSKRYQEEEIQKLTDDDSFLVGCAQVQDKFGDNGITGVFIVNKQNPKEWFLDSFLLSCRVMGREVEKAILNYIVNEARKQKTEKIIAEFLPTKKNKPAENFLPQCGFIKSNNKWIYDVNNPLKLPEFLSVKIENE